ncbi:hypothetical protein OXPF_09980 [Oxobacter pfennigii]|uniref:Uncharacterized protein n=1 Tax=Oxobacter pfennigii TaxID=36849 RepID=A0A0P8X4R2_9CLOT|nr:hypothetical protein [Oxobacter pfennigii]KPU45764.1 hypothetical protein OXPF_09980 [Oxobacter pfennigii]
MDMELVMAILSGIVSLVVFLNIFAYLNRIFNIDLPDIIGFILMLAGILGLYIKRDFFFGFHPIITGVTVGTILALLWDIKGAGFMIYIKNTILTFRFWMWIIALVAGIYSRYIMLNSLDEYLIQSINEINQYLLIASLILIILGSFLLLYPEVYAQKNPKNSGFSIYKRISKGKKAAGQIIGFILVLIFSIFLVDALSYISSFFNIII